MESSKSDPLPTKFTEQGFLSTDILQTIRDYRGADPVIHKAYLEVNHYVLSFLLTHKVRPSDLQEVLSGALLGRLMTLYQAIYVLACRGMNPAVHCLMRAMVEAHFNLHYVSKSRPCAEAFVQTETHEKIRNLKELERHADNHTAVSLDRILELKSTLDKLKSDEDSPNLTTRDIAEATGRGREYDSLYSDFCRHLHGRSGSLREALILDDENKIRGLKWGPHTKGMGRVLTTSMSLLLEALTAQNFVYFIKDSPEYEAYATRTNEMIQETKEDLLNQDTGDL